MFGIRNFRVVKKMRIRKILLITFLLSAFLAIGAVSAADEIASDNMTVTDEATLDSVECTDEVAFDSEAVTEDDGGIVEDDKLSTKYVDGDFYIDVDYDKRINLDNPNVEFAWIFLPDYTNGQFRMYNGEELIVNIEINDDSYDYDYECLLEDIQVSDISDKRIHLGDKIAFKFYEYVNGKLELDDAFSRYFKVTEYGSHMVLTKINASEMTNIIGHIEVNSTNISKPYENFAYVYVDSKDGTFIIKAIDDLGGEFEIFRENLRTSSRPWRLDDVNGNRYYRLGFNFNDINKFLKDNDEDGTFLELVEGEVICDNEIIFMLVENDKENIVEDYRPMLFNIGSDGIISFKDNSNYYVDVDYVDLEILMDEGWQDNDLLTFYVRKGITGKMVIRLNDNETPVFEKSTVGLTPDYSDEKYNIFIVKAGDLNITKAGKYLIRDSFVKDNGEIIYEYNKRYPETLKLRDLQSLTEKNVTITINPLSMVQDGDEYFIAISSNASKNDTVVIKIRGLDPITIKLNETRFENETYLIGSRELKMKLPASTDLYVEVVYKDKVFSGNINILPNIDIDILDERTIYTTFEDIYVYLTLHSPDEVIFTKTNGTITLIITNYYDRVVKTMQCNITDLERIEDSYVIRSNASDNLNGRYNIIVRYTEGNEASVQVRGITSIKPFDSKDYGTSITESVKDVNDTVITFAKLPCEKDIYVEIDGNTIKFPVLEIEDVMEPETYIKFNQLGELADGIHSIKIYIVDEGNRYDVANGTVIVDVVENIDPSLSISIANIIEGAAANIVISTNETFTGDVLVKIGDNNYTVSVTNGNGSLIVPGLAVGTYNATAFFKANAFFNESTKNTTFAVNPKVATGITAQTVTTTYATSKNIAVTLKDADGNPLAGKEIVITLNGASKTVKTNDKGQAVLAIGTKLAPKKYDATFKFAGDSNYLASTGTVKVTVNKAKPKITAKKKTFKAKKKTKKYTIVLKTDKKKPLKKVKVTIKIGKKKFTAKTNKKGKATFKLKKLTKKGKYKATVKFSGNKYYKAVSKKVKITIKK